jgi:hypothetical protein
MATTIASFRAPVRAVLGDSHPTLQQYHADQIDEAVRLVIRLGRAPGVTLSTDAQSTVQNVTPFDNEHGKNWARIVLNAAKRFVVANAASGSFRTRALAETFGEQREMVLDLLDEIYRLDCDGGGE